MSKENGSYLQRSSVESPVRHALANVSPNIKSSHHATHLFDNKPPTGSPLKRSFSVALEEQGLKYFKRSKLSPDVSLSGQELVRQPVDGVSSLSDHQSQLVPRLRIENVPQAVEEPSPTEPNTPTSLLDEEEVNSSADRKSFSSLINYDPSSQTGAPSQQSKGLLFNGPSYAELLKLRLRIAMYKVRTNQITVPFTELREERETMTGTRHEPSLPSEVVIPRNGFSTSSTTGRISTPTLLPAPVLRPTPYHCRMVHDMSLPSSPVPEIATPRGPRTIGALDDVELTSSIVKGRGAEALLGLRNAV